MKLSEKNVEELISMLAHMRLRPGMYIGDATYKNLFNWWAGFIQGCRLFGFDVAEHIKTVFLRRGWEDSLTGPVPSMREKGLSEDEIVLEYITIIIQAIQMKTGIGNEPILKIHQSMRDMIAKNNPENPNPSKELEQLLSKIEADMQRTYDE